MKSYTLHVPRDAAPSDPGALDKAVLVKEGFSWGAFFFTALWFFVHRLWIAGLLVLLAVLGLAFGLQTLRVGAGTVFLAELLLAILIGLEASSLWRWTLRRNGKPAVDVVAAADREEAETKAFARWLSAPAGRGYAGSREQGGRLVPPQEPAFATPYRTAGPIIGLFPEAERRS
jgi:hypothetical protein